MQPNSSEDGIKIKDHSPKSINTNTYNPSSSQNNIIKKSTTPPKSLKASNKSTSDRSDKTAKEERALSVTQKASISNKSRSKSHHSHKHSHHTDYSPYKERYHSKRREEDYKRHTHHGHSHSRRDSNRYDSHKRYYDYDYDRYYRHHHHDYYYYEKERSRSRSRRHRSIEKKKDAKDFMEERRRVRESSRSNSALRAMKVSIYYNNYFIDEKYRKYLWFLPKNL